eukprot:1149058-Pelagomonas_calceolata.AAC.9
MQQHAWLTTDGRAAAAPSHLPVGIVGMARNGQPHRHGWWAKQSTTVWSRCVARSTLPRE